MTENGQGSERSEKLLLASEVRARQQEEVVRLGLLALGGGGLQELFDEACRSVTNTLGHEYSAVLELLPSRDLFIIRASAGWQLDLPSDLRSDASIDSMLGYTLKSPDPVVAEELSSERRFQSPDFLAGRGAASGMSVIIAGDRWPFGVLCSYTSQPRSFSEDDVHFMQSMANLLATAVQRKRHEEAIRFHTKLLDTVGQAVVATDLRGRVTYWNAAAQQLSGWSSIEVFGRAIRELTSIEVSRPDLRSKLMAGESWSGEFDIRRKDGSSFPALVTITPIRDEKNEVVGLIAVTVDLTERKREEERYRHLFENAVFGVFQTTPEGRFITANRALAAMFGYSSPEELISEVTDIGAQVHADPSRRVEFVRLLEEEGSVSGFEAEARRRDGSRIHVSMSGRVVRDATGAVVSYEGIVQDISIRRRALEELREQKRILETIEQVGASLAAELDISKTAQAVTDAATELTGAQFGAFFYNQRDESGDYYSLYTLSGADPAAIEDFHIPPITPLFESTFRGLGIVRCDDVRHDPRYGQLASHFGALEGHLPVRSFLAVPVISRSGDVIGALFFGHSEVGVFVEHHETLAAGIARWAGIAVDNARLYNEAQQVQEQLRQANESKDEFLGLVSHELRTPITAIYGGARLLQSRGRTLDQERQEEILSDIEQESERLYRLVEDLLALARLELGAAIALNPILLQRAIDRMVTAFAKRRPSRPIELAVPEDLPPLEADDTYVEQIMRNLVGNADKYSPADQPITIQAEVTGDCVTVRVMDRGPGLPQGELERIFERFYRAEGTARQASGLGIGLTVCKRLVEAQSGRIWPEARPGGGLIMSFTLPIASEASEA